MKNIKQILAIIGVILYIVIVITTLITAICDTTPNMWVFKGFLILTIFIPIISYCYICLHKYAMTRSGRKDYYSKEDNDKA